MRFLLDEMFPPIACAALVDLGHDAVHVRELGLDARPDAEVAIAARAEHRVLVTENVKDFALERDLAVVCVLKARLRRRDLTGHLVQLLDTWAQATPYSYLGLHWPH